MDGLVEVAVLGSDDGKVNVRIRAALGVQTRTPPLSISNGSYSASAGTRSPISKFSRPMAAPTPYRYRRSALPRCESRSQTKTRPAPPTGQTRASAARNTRLYLPRVRVTRSSRATSIELSTFGVPGTASAHHAPRHPPYLRLTPCRTRRTPPRRDGHPSSQSDLIHDGDLHSGSRQGDQGRT